MNLGKQQHRKQMKGLLTCLSEHEKDLESQEMLGKITRFILSSPEIKMVASYAALPLEINLDALHSAFPEVSFCYPICGEKGKMEFHSVSDISEMKCSRHGIREPDASLHKRIAPESIDLFLCPAYGYTQNGERLGKGGGYYDRYLLRKHPDAITLGVVFSSQIIDHIITEAHDLRVDRVL